MNQFPEIARPILEAIRAEVPRWEPKDLYRGNPLVLPGAFRDKKGCCPMGCLKGATLGTPTFSRHLKDRDWGDGMIYTFAGWFDAFEDLREAVLAVWGPEPTSAER